MEGVMPPTGLPSQKSSLRGIHSTRMRYAIGFAFLLLIFNTLLRFPFSSTSLLSAKLFIGRCCGPGCRAPINETISKHYDTEYFKWQTELGRKKAAGRSWSQLFDVHNTDIVADLGAGGGHILATLNVSRRIAVEVNPVARATIHQECPNLIETIRFPEELEENSPDIVYSISAIEHFECPLTELKEMDHKLRVGGKMIIGVKNERVQYARDVTENEPDQHIYTWNRQLLYNLVKSAGLKVQKVNPPRAQAIHLGRNWTHPKN